MGMPPMKQSEPRNTLPRFILFRRASPPPLLPPPPPLPLPPSFHRGNDVSAAVNTRRGKEKFGGTRARGIRV